MDNLKKRPLVKFRRPAILYALLLVFALIFTQALRATASAVLFGEAEPGTLREASFHFSLIKW